MDTGATTGRARAFSWKKSFLLLCGLLALGVAWFVGYRQGDRPTPPPSSHAVRLGGYQYVNPLLLTDNRGSDRSSDLSSLQTSLQQYIDGKKADRKVERMSVIVRDMNTGRWTGVNEDDVYSPASLMKVPVLMTYLHEADDHPEMLTSQYRNDAKDDPDGLEFYKPSESLRVGQTYPATELMASMIISSSNAALQTLAAHMDQKPLDDFYSLLGYNTLRQNVESDFLSPRQYALLFRVLYNGTYIGPDFSEKVLELMAHSEFKDGLVKGLPGGASVAHKFGERAVPVGGISTEIKRELHDCGIVYAPGHPYLICVMTQGTSFPDLADAIAGASQITYEASKGF